ncbi:MaoC family dehydratase [Chloroflexota bacterium]
MIDTSDLKEGFSLPELRKHISQDKINSYAEVSKDFNPIHIDEEFARNTPLGGTIAHGMMILAYISQMMTGSFGQDWLSDGNLNIRFKASARPGDTIIVSGKIRHIKKSDDQTMIACEILCRNRTGEAVITGEATVRVKNDENNG